MLMVYYGYKFIKLGWVGQALLARTIKDGSASELLDHCLEITEGNSVNFI